jgi:tetratricopeptide (TPR) repeat protein
MSPGEIASGLSDRFRLLTGGRRTAVPRQQTLHALIDWSWDLLTDDDRRLLRRLSTFTGGWTVAAAAGVAGEPDGGDGLMDAIDGLTRLVDRSLVIVDRGATTRYRMLETIRQYAREQLIRSGESDAIATRHARFFLALAETAEPELRGPSMVDWLDRLDTEIENLGAAFEWTLEIDPEIAIRMGTALLEYWTSRVPSPDNQERVVAAVAVARRILAGPPPPTPEQRIGAARFLGMAARKWSLNGQGAVGLGWAEDALAAATIDSEPTTLILAMVGLTTARIFTGDRDDALRYLDEVIRLATELGDQYILAFTAGGVAGNLALHDPVAAARLTEIGLEAARRSGNPQAIALVSMGQGRQLARDGRFDEARALMQAAIDRFAETGDERLREAARSELAHTARRSGDLDGAMEQYRVSIHGWVRSGNRGAVAHQLENVAFVLVARGSPEDAARLLGAASALREAADSPMMRVEQVEHDGWVEQLRASADPAAVDAAIAAGRTLTMAEAVELAVGAA